MTTILYNGVSLQDSKHSRSLALLDSCAASLRNCLLFAPNRDWFSVVGGDSVTVLSIDSLLKNAVNNKKQSSKQLCKVFY
jgi:NDP-sugar pyrophosphorylase family protein